jgi:hypothetical protein
MFRFLSTLSLLLTLLVTPALAAKTTSSLPLDARDTRVQGFAPNIARTQAPVSISAGATATVTVTGWLAISFRPSGAVQVYLNDQTTKYMTFNGEERQVLLLDGNVTAVKFKNPGTSALTLEVWGM